MTEKTRPDPNSPVLDERVAVAVSRFITRREALQRAGRWFIAAGVTLSTSWMMTRSAQAAGCSPGGVVGSYNCGCRTQTMRCGNDRCCPNQTGPCCHGAEGRCDFWATFPYCWCSPGCCESGVFGYYSCCTVGSLVNMEAVALETPPACAGIDTRPEDADAFGHVAPCDRDSPTVLRHS